MLNEGTKCSGIRKGMDHVANRSLLTIVMDHRVNL